MKYDTVIDKGLRFLVMIKFVNIHIALSLK